MIMIKVVMVFVEANSTRNVDDTENDDIGLRGF